MYFFISLLNELLLSVSSRISILDLSTLSEQDLQSSDSDENNVKILEKKKDGKEEILNKSLHGERMGENHL